MYHLVQLLKLTHSGGVSDGRAHGAHALAVLRLQLEVVGGARAQAVDAGAGSVPGHGHRGPLLGAGEAGGAAALDRVHH